MQARLSTAALLLLLVAMPQAASAQGMSPVPQPAPKPVTLTKQDVERLLVVLPQVAKEGAKFNRKNGGEADPRALRDSAEMQHIEGILKQHGLTMMDFAMQTAALVSTYLALSPEAFEAQLPHESDPEVQRILKDPNVSNEHKEAVRQQVKMAQENKELLRAQLTQLASEENKQVVRPVLERVKTVLDQVQKETGQSTPQGSP